MDADRKTALDERSGWPEELKVLLRRHPRETWTSNGSPLARFWLDRHDVFRQQSGLLRGATDEFRAGQRTAEELGVWSAPRLQAFLSALHGHHQIEDFHYFPAFRAAEQRLAAGFDALAADHRRLHEDIVNIVEAANDLLHAIRESADVDAQRHAGERYAAASDALLERLLRHLDDEEDLIIPVMLDRGE